MNKLGKLLIYSILIFSFSVSAQERIEPSFLYGYLAGDYTLIGKESGGENTYLGKVKIINRENFIEVRRTIGSQTITGKGKLEFAGPDEIPFLKVIFIFDDNEIEASYMWQSDFDNYARISGYIYNSSEKTDNPGMEVMFINRNPLSLENESKKMIKGLRTVKYGVTDIVKGKEWYTKALGFGPYFDEPFYVGFNVDGYELGLDPDTPPAQSGDAGVVAYWGVENIEHEYQRLLSIGARVHSEITDVGGGIKVATVLDPFGNVFGIIYNPHFKESTEQGER